MKKSFIAITFCTSILILLSFAIKPQQSGGITFHRMSLEEAKKLSAESGKLIFIDCYTSWCGPCKRMAATSFKDAKVAQVYNQKFINLKIDIEKDMDGPEIAKSYKIKSYPTLLYIKGNGKLMKRKEGIQEAEDLLSIAADFD